MGRRLRFLKEQLYIYNYPDNMEDVKGIVYGKVT